MEDLKNAIFVLLRVDKVKKPWSARYSRLQKDIQKQESTFMKNVLGGLRDLEDDLCKGYVGTIVMIEISRLTPDELFIDFRKI